MAGARESLTSALAARPDGLVGHTLFTHWRLVMNKLQEFQTLMSELSTTARLSVNEWSLRMALRHDTPETVVVNIHFTIPGKKTALCKHDKDLLWLLTERYNIDETDPQVAAILERMDNYRATAIAEARVEHERELAEQAESKRVREQFPDRISEYELMQEILRLRNGEASTTDALLIADLRERLGEAVERIREQGLQIDELEVRVDHAERGEAVAQKTALRALAPRINKLG